MTVSTSLIHLLKRDSTDEPLAKRLKLAENVLYSPEIFVPRKEDCIFDWLCSELSDENEIEVWNTIHYCLSTDPTSFSKLSIESKNLLTEKLIQSLNAYPEKEVSEEMVKSSTYIFFNASSQNYSTKNKVVFLIEAIIIFTYKVINLKESDNDHHFQKSDVAIECVECAIGTIIQICKQHFFDIKKFTIIFIEEILFPLSVLVQIIKLKKISSKLIIESQQCIKKLILDDIRSNIPSAEENNTPSENYEFFFNTLKDKIKTSKFEDIKAVFTCLFDSTIYNFRQNSVFIDFILRNFYKCIEHKNQSKQILAILLENSVDVSYNFDNKVEGVTFSAFLKTHIDDIKSKKKCLKCSDYELLSAISKLNPLLLEDLIQNLLERILFEKKTSENEIVAYENLITDLWKCTVRLRRQHKFIVRFLLAINCLKKEKEDFKFINQFNLPKNFISEFGKDLKSRTTSAQILAMFNTLLFHLKTDCLKELKIRGSINQICLSIKIVANFFITFFEHSNFLDNSLTFDWQVNFYRSFTDLHNVLTEFSESLCECIIQHETLIFTSFINIVKIWCETYDSLRYYIPNIACNELNFPINEIQLQKLKEIVKECNDQDCFESLNQLTLFKSVIYNRNNQQIIKDKTITHHWSVIIKNHFEIIEFFTENQLLKLTLHLVKEASCTQDNLDNWTLILKQNISRITQKFATAVAIQCILNIIKDIDLGSTKTIIENIDFEIVLKAIDDPSCKKVLRHAIKEIGKQDFKSLNITNLNEIKFNLILMSNLPLSSLDTQVRKFLFIILYILDKEANVAELKEFITNLYTEFLSHNDIDILNSVRKPKNVIHHFKDNSTILLKIFKPSLKKLSTLSFFENFIDKKICDRKISSILLICIENSKNKAAFNNCKSSLQNLSLKLCNKIINELDVEISSSHEISALRVLLKIVLSTKQELKENLKSCVELTLKNMTQDTEKLYNDKLIQEILQLSLLALQHRKHFKITDDVLQNLCIIFINNPNRKIFFYFLEILKDNEFQFFVNSINIRTKESLKNSDVPVLEKLTLIWESLSKAEAKVTRSKAVSSSINNLVKTMFISEIKDFSSIFLLKIYRTFVTSKRMIRLTHILVDSIFVTSMDCLNNLNEETKLIATQEALGLCSDFMRSKEDFILDRLPVLINFFRIIVQIILKEAKNVNFNNEPMLKILAVDIEKCCTFFAKLKKDIARISPHLIADLISMSHGAVLPQFMKISIDFSLSHLLSNCDRHAITFLFRTLPVSNQQVFKTAYQNYLKYNKFTGKI